MKQLRIDIGRTNIIPVSLPDDVSSDTFASEIREEEDPTSNLIATWNVSFLTDGTDGELVLTLDDSETFDMIEQNGFMDIKRTSGGEPLSVFEEPIQVLFRYPVTA